MAIKADETRPRYGLVEMIKALQGFRNPDGHVVLPQWLAEDVVDELERLYAAEADATGDDLPERLRP